MLFVPVHPTFTLDDNLDLFFLVTDREANESAVFEAVLDVVWGDEALWDLSWLVTDGVDHFVVFDHGSNVE
jgi:hypothetical protein